ncbi:MAG: hypothetical protein EOM20_14240 [Spartobacteria bacterium]|nr:hypothetical protein [Spartobacteria bacterium]
MKKGFFLILLGFWVSGGVFADVLRNAGFEEGDLSCWRAEADQLEIGVSASTTYMRNYAGRMKGTLHSAQWITNTLRQTLRAAPGDTLRADGMVFWRNWTSETGAGEARLDAVLESSFGEVVASWGQPHDAWTPFSLTGSIFGVANPGFEGGSTAGWRLIPDQLHVAASTNACFEGMWSGCIFGEWSGWTFSQMYQQSVVEAGETLEARARIYVDTLSTDGDWAATGLKLERAGGGPVGEILLDQDCPKNQWLPLSITLPASEGGEYILRCLLAGGSGGTDSIARVYFDDVRLWKQGGMLQAYDRTLGVADQSHAEFQLSGFSGAPAPLATATAADFPCRLHDTEWNVQYFYDFLDESQAGLDMALELTPAMLDGADALRVILEYYDGAEWTEAGATDISSNGTARIVISADGLAVNKNSFRLRVPPSETDTHGVYWDQVRLRSLVSISHTLGTAGDGDGEFRQPPYSGESIDLDLYGAAQFPKELNLYSWTMQHFHFAVDEDGASQDMLVVLTPCWNDGDGALSVALEYWNHTAWVEADRTSVNGQTDGELYLPAAALEPGVNSFRLRALEGSGGTQVVTWDQIRICTAGRNTSPHDVKLLFRFCAHSGADTLAAETEVRVDACRVLGSTAGLQPPASKLDALREAAAAVALDGDRSVPFVSYPGAQTYGSPGGAPPQNYPSDVEVHIPGWSFNALEDITNEVTTTAAVILYELPGEGPGYIEFDRFAFCDRFWHNARYATPDIHTSGAPFFVIGQEDNTSEEFGDGPFPDEHTYLLGSPLYLFPKRLSTQPGDGWPCRLNIVYPVDYSSYESWRDKYYIIDTVATNGPALNVKTLKVDTYVTGDGIPEVNVASREHHMGWAERESAYGMVDYPNVNYAEHFAAGLRNSGANNLYDDGVWYMQQVARGCITVKPMTLYALNEGSWIEKIYHECDFIWANAGSGVRSVFDDDRCKRLPGQASYFVGFKVGRLYDPVPGGGAYYTHLIELRGNGYVRMTDYEAYMGGSFRPVAHDLFGLYKNGEDFPLMPEAYARVIPTSIGADHDDSFAEIFLPFQSDRDNRVIGAARMALHMAPDEVRHTGAYFDMDVDLWANRDIVQADHSPLTCFAQVDMCWRATTNIADGTEAHDIDTVLLKRADGEWIHWRVHNPPTNLYVHPMGVFQTNDTVYLLQQDRCADSYGFEPGGAYHRVSGYEITMLDNAGLPTEIEAHVQHTDSEYKDNAVVSCPIRRDIAAGEQLSYRYRYRALNVPGVQILHPSTPDGANQWSGSVYTVVFRATDGDEALQANVYYGNGQDNDWTLINTGGPIPVSTNTHTAECAWDAGAVAPGAYYIRVEATRLRDGRTGFDVSRARLQAGPRHTFARTTSTAPTPRTNDFVHLGNNMGFETGHILGWAALADHLDIYATDLAACEGRYAARIHGAWSGWSWNNLQQDIPCLAGETLHVKGRIFINGFSESTTDWAACGIMMESYEHAGRTSTGVEFSAVTPTGVWLNVDFERVAPVDGYDRLVLWVGGMDCPHADVLFDRIEVTSRNGSEVVTNRPETFWASVAPVDVTGHTALRFMTASTNRGEQLGIWVADAAGVTSRVDVMSILPRLQSLPRAISIPWHRFAGIDPSAIRAIGFEHAYDEIGVWQLASVAEPLTACCALSPSDMTDAIGLAHFNPGQVITNILTITNHTSSSVTAAVIQVIHEYGEDRHWVDTFHSPWVHSLSFEQGDRLCGQREQCWYDRFIAPGGTLVLTNTYPLPEGKRVNNAEHWMPGYFDWFIGRNYPARGQVHVVARDASGHALLSDARAAFYAMDDDFDFDNDGLPDAFEMNACGSVTGLVGALDVDYDGFTAMQEFIAGTDPLNAGSRPLPRALSGAAGDIEILTSPGRAYWLEWTDTLAPPDWRAVDADALDGDGTARVLTDPDAEQAAQRYYRTGIRLLHSAWPP